MRRLSKPCSWRWILLPVPSAHATTDALPQVRIRRFEFLPRTSGSAPKINVLYENYGPTTVQVRIHATAYVVESKRPFGEIPMNEEVQAEKDVWDNFLSLSKTSPFITLPPLMNPWFTVTGPILTEDQFRNLELRTQTVRVFIVGTFEWKGTEESPLMHYEFCAFSAGDAQVIFSCNRHNGVPPKPQ